MQVRYYCPRRRLPPARESDRAFCILWRESAVFPARQA
ncbi:hypothetical protein EVA_07783 [gut metagenome]|uniref:Uncharacterized protein n=1 Tax=gut metagenome TaxID=749906 RepID=J9GUJ6_9ZZZZ